MFKNAKKKILSLVLAMVMVVTAFVPAMAADGIEPNTVTILHTNDMHAKVISDGKVIGADLVATVKKSIDNAVLFDAGDALQGTTIATLSKGADIVELMNLAGYDAMTAGNHEFDYGQDQLLVNAELANFPILSANTKKDGKLLLEGLTYAGGAEKNNGANTVIEKNGVKIGVFGITTPQTATSANPEGLVGITFEDTIETSKAQIELLKEQGAELIVGLMHAGIDKSSPITSREIAEGLEGTGIHIIIDGHSHSQLNEIVAGIHIAQTGTASANLGKLTVKVDNDKVTVTGELLAAADVIANYEPDAAIAAKAAELTEAIKPLLAPVVGKTSTTLWGGTVNGTNEARLGEVNLGNLIGDSMVAEAKKATSTMEDGKYKELPVLAFQNGGGIRAVIKDGDVTVGDILAVLPFGNLLAYLIVTPDVLYEAMEFGVGGVTAQDTATGKLTGIAGKFPQIGGFRIQYDPNQPAGEKIEAIYLAGSSTPLDRKDTTTQMILCSNDFLVAGGDGYEMLGALTKLGEGRLLDVVLLDYITELTKEGTVPFDVPSQEGRIKTVGEFQPKAYTGTIVVTDKNEIGLEGVEVSYTVENDEKVTKAVTNKKGEFKVENLPDGPQGVRVTIDGKEYDDVLINNYSGAGVTSKVAIKLAKGSTYGDIEKHWAREAIYYLSSKGFVYGTSVDTYSPNENVTRGEFVEGLATIAGYNPVLFIEAKFDDVDPNSEYGPAVAWALENGISVGTGKLFEPDKSITRAEMATMILRFVEKQGFVLTETNAAITFGDQEQIPAFAAAGIAKMQKAGIINGTPEKLFLPLNTATRAESAQILSLLLKMQ